MPASLSHLSYGPEYEIMDKALDDERGIRVQMASKKSAEYYRFRLHNARSVDREKNKEIYEPGMEMYGRSTYDQLICRVVETKGGHWVYIERAPMPAVVESLSYVRADEEPLQYQGDAEPLPEPVKVLALPFKRR